MQNPFHEGELQVQKLAGEEAMAERNGVMISNRVMGGALPFLAQQSMAVFASRDEQGRVWASMLFGSRGFMKSVDGRSVDFDLSMMAVDRNDPFWRNVEVGSSVGMIAIELGTRRRIRINGEISRPTETTLQLSVKESYPNCPKYITRRVVRTGASGVRPESEISSGGKLGTEQKRLLERGDVLFIATAHPTRGADASHRGGNPGFIEVLDEKTVRIPDYAGNSMFNTLGNLAVDSAAGLVVPDFEHGRVLMLTGKAEVLFNDDDGGEATGGTHRFLVFQVKEWLQLAAPVAVETELLDYSPFNPK
jgi:predicted pyridoxine 5'-phosphate oxidase superfamily flavin-nucleotide-binding protein